MKRHVTTVVVMAGLFAACAGDDETATTDSIASTTPTTAAAATVPSTIEPFEAESPPDRLVGSYQLQVVGIGRLFEYLELSPAGDGRVLSMDDAEELHFAFEVDGERMRVSTVDESWDCGPEDTGLYEWASAGQDLTLTLVADQCVGRAADLLASSPFAGPAGDTAIWSSLGDTPVIQVTGARAPVSVESPIGTIEWTPNELDETEGSRLSFADGLIAGDEGFFALQDTEHGPAVMHSPDGLSWFELPAPPETPEYLTVLDDTVTVTAGLIENGSPVGTWPARVYSTSDLGATWNEVAVDPVPAGATVRATSSVGGGAGTLVLTRSGGGAENTTVGPIWLGSPGRLELVEPPFVGAAGIAIGWALDSSFLVHTGTGFELPLAGEWWTSPDGRSWSEMDSVPCGLDVVAIDGDTIYGKACMDISVISPDGGLTWDEGGYLPVGKVLFLESSDGQLVVEAGVGWGCGSSVSASAGDGMWQPVFVPWPTVFIDAAVSGDSVLLRTQACEGGPASRVDFVGTITPE